MNSGFTLGKSYPRTALLAFVGSRQQQSGIIWGDACAEAVICTSGGKHGAEAAYKDERHTDGTWSYFGQGANGDQDKNAFANQLLVNGQRSVLLFTTREPTAKEVQVSGHRQKQYTFVGEFCVGSWDNFAPETGKRQGNRLLKFTLVPITEKETYQPETDSGPNETRSEILSEVRSLLSQGSTAPRKGTFQPREYFLRSALLRKYVRIRANGQCEYCQRPAPFATPNNMPFLEIHHILRLADYGPDAPTNVVALCPNCHREAHYGANAHRIRVAMLEIARNKET